MQTARELTLRNDVFCALCQGQLTVHGCYQRHFIDDGGNRHNGWIAQSCCRICRVYPSLIPDFLMPHKHYKAEVIEKAIFEAEEKEVLSYCSADDSTMRRWVNQFKERGSQAVGWLLSALFILYNRHISTVELHNKSLLEQLAVLLREYRIPWNGSIIGRVNIILTMYNYGFL
jgi:hypothetical protein